MRLAGRMTNGPSDTRMNRILLLLGVLAGTLLQGCSGESAFPEATGKATVRAINAIESSPSIAFLIEQRVIASVDYKNATGAQQYDDLEYRFNFETVFPEGGRKRIASRLVDVIADKDYTFVLSGRLANPAVTLWEGDVRTFSEGDTVFETRFAHTAGTVGDIDAYFAAPGVDPALGQQVATLSFGDISPAVDYSEGEYVLIFTEAGDPSAVVFTSGTIEPDARSAFIISIFDGDANDLGDVSVRFFSAAGGTLRIVDTNLPPTVRFFHASTALGTSDIYVGDPAVDPPVVTDHAFGEFTGDIPITAGANALTYTASGDTAVILFEEERTFAVGNHNHYYVIGETNALTAIAGVPDRRSVETFVKFTILHAAANHDLVDFYLVEADADIAEFSPAFFGVPFATGPLDLTLAEGSFDLYLTVPGEKTIIAGPVRVDAALGDVIDAIALDTVDPATADIVLIPLP